MESILSFIGTYKEYFTGAFVFIGIVLIGLYFDIFSKFRIRRGVRGNDDIRKYLDEYLDEDGKLLLEKLSKVWSDDEEQYKYSQEEVERLLGQTAEITERELVTRAESILAGPKSLSPGEFFEKLPAEEKIASLFGEDFLDEILKEEGGTISKASKTILAEKLWTVIESRGDNKKLSELPKEDLINLAKEIKGGILGTGSSSLSMRASDIANEVSQEVDNKTEEEAFVVSKLESEGDEPVELSIDEKFKGNLPEKIKNRLLDLGVPTPIVERIYFQSNDYIKLQHLFEYLWSKPVEDVLKFYNSLYISKELKYFLNQSYEPVKLFKDFLVFVLNNYKSASANVDKEVNKAFPKAFQSAEFYTYLALKNPQAYKKKRHSMPAFFTFLGILVAYESGVSSDFEDTYIKFMEKLIKYLNVKNEGIAYRTYVIGKKGEDEEFSVSYDHIGFTFKDDIYLIPKALDIIFGRYFLAIPYIFRKDFYMTFSPEHPAHISRYLLKFSPEKTTEERIEVLTKVRKDSRLYLSIMNNLVNKKNKINNYAGLQEVIKI